MRPVLFDKTATTFTSLGLGMLTDVTSAIVTEEVNGIFDLELDIAKSDPLYNSIERGSIITAIPSPFRSPEPFRVYKIEKSLNGISTVYAHHISYDLAGIIVNPYTAASAGAAMSGISSHLAQSCNFTFTTTKTTSASFSLSTPQAVRSVLGGTEGSILDVYRGEYIFKGYSVQLVTNRGTNRGIEIRYRKNLVGISVEEDASGEVDGVIPIWTSEGHTPVYGSIQWKTGLSSGRVAVKDYSESYQDAPTTAQLNAAASALVNTAGYGEPKISIEVDFVHLGTEQTGYKALEQCDLGDTVKVIAEPLGTSRAAEVVAIETDVLREIYQKVTIGSVRADVAQKIVANQKAAEDAAKTTRSFLEASLDAATALITGAEGGNIKFLYDANGKPTTLLAMDTDDASTAQNVLMLNYQGWGLSTTGVNGPFSYALTADTGLNASLINVGTLQGIRAILESGSIGGWDIESNWIKKDFNGHDPNGNARTIRVALASPSGDSSWVLYSMYTISGVMYPMFVIGADGSAQFRTLDGLVVGETSAHKNSFLHGYLTVDDTAYLNDSAVINGTLWLQWSGANTGRIYAPTDHELYAYPGNDVNRAVKLSQTSGHWGFHPYADTYLDLGLSGNRWDNIYAQNGTIQTSDKNAKKSIKNLPKKAIDFIRGLKPKSFQMRKGTSGRRHWGFIAQDVEECMEALGIKPENFAGIVKDEEGRYGLRYEELIAPLVMAVQDLDKRISKLEGKDDVTS